MGASGATNTYLDPNSKYNFGKRLFEDVTGQKKAASPGPSFTEASPEQKKDYWSNLFRGNEQLDEGSRASLLAQLEEPNVNYASVEQRYKDILDPESESGKARILMLQRAKVAKDQPGLKAQTSFLGPTSSSSGGFLGGR